MALMVLAGVDAQTSPELPRIVVNIVVDQLRTDYLEAFAPLYGEDGFKRLMREARYYNDCQQPFRTADRASASACVITGAVPFDNGIPALSWLSRQTLQPVFCVDDSRYAGHQTHEKTSPASLLTTTLSDELEMATGQLSMVISIAPERDMAVLLAGHIADGAYWLNDQTGAWSGTTYYGKDYPYWADVYGRSEGLAQRIGKMEWTPWWDGALGDFHYFHSASSEKTKPFEHKFAGDRRYRQLKSSALVNDEVAQFVDACLAGCAIGRDRTPDLLNIGLYAGNFDHQSVVSHPAEMQDTYVRLDHAIARILKSVEAITGKEHMLVVVSSTGYADSDAADIDFASYRIPTGTFSMARAAMLLNMYLSALYGQAQYVEATYGGQIYLDHTLIEQRQLNIVEVLTRSEDFLSQMSGVREIYTSQRLIIDAWADGINRVRAGWNASCSGDILIEVNPGWRVEAENGRTYVSAGQAYTAYPLFFLGANVVSERISTPVSAAAIAPTLSQCLRIRAPNGSREAPLVLH